MLTDTEQPTETKPYWQIADEWKQFLAQNPDLSVDLPGFAQRKQDLGEGDYSAGLGTDNAVRRGQANIDRALHHFGGRDAGGSFSVSELLGGSPEGVDLPKRTGELVRSGAESVGAGPELAQKLGHVGEGFPRMAVDLGVGTAIGGMPGMALMSGLSTYGETGRLAPSALAGATAYLFPKAAEFAGSEFLKRVGAPMLKDARPDLLYKATRLKGEEEAARLGSQLVPGSLAQSVGEFTSRQLGMFGLGVGSNVAGSTLNKGEGDVFQNPVNELTEQFKPSSLIATAAAQLPFTALDILSPGQRPTSDLTRRLLPEWKSEFADKFTRAYQADREKAGLPADRPAPGMVKNVIERLLEQKPVPPVVGKVLASMDVKPTISFDYKTPLKTTDGEWNMQDAVNETKSLAADIAKARNVADISDIQDQHVFAALRTTGTEGNMTKRDLGRLAAERVVDTLANDGRNLRKTGYDDTPSKEFQQYQDLQRTMDATDADITARVTPLLDDGSPNPLHDPQLALRIALVSGDVGHRLDIGIDRPVVMSARRGDGETIPLETSIIDKVRGLLPVKGDADEQQQEIANLQARVVDLDQQIHQTEGQGDLFNNPELDKLKGQRIQLQQIIADLSGVEGGPDEARTRGKQLTAEATFAARNAARNFPGTVDIRDPESVRSLYEYVKAAINTAETGFYRRRSNQEGVYDKDGKLVTYPTKEAAEQVASELNANREDQGAYRFEVNARKDKDGVIKDWTVFKQNYYRTFGEGKEAGEEPSAEAGEGAPDFEPVKEAFEEGISKEALSPFGEALEKAQSNEVLEQMQRLLELPNPAVREGRRAALTQNVIDYVAGLSDGVIASVIKPEIALDPTGVSIREPAKIRARIVKFMQFIRDGGDIKLKYKKVGSRLRVTGEGDITGLNEYMGELGYSSKRAAWGLNTRNMQFKDDVGGLNFFEQFQLVTKLVKQEFMDPNRRSIDQRPRGDLAWLPQGYIDEVMDSLVVDPKLWADQKNAISGGPPERWPLVKGAVEEGVVVMKDQRGQTVRLDVARNPLMTMIVQGARRQLTTTAGVLYDMLRTYAPNTDPNMLQFLKGMVGQAYGRDIRVGFGVPKKAGDKGYYHYGNDLLTGTGILLGPFSPHGSKLAELDAPESIAKHFVEEMGHVHTVFAFHHDAVVNHEIKQIHELATKHFKEMMDLAGQGRFTQATIHGLDSPEEMLATVFKDADLQNFLRGIKDPFGALPEANLWDRLVQLFRSVFQKIVGADTDTLLARLTDVTTMAAESTLRNHQAWGVKHEGDIYDALTRGQGKKGDLIVGAKPQPVPRTGEETASRTFLQNPPRDLSPIERFTFWEGERKDAEKAFKEANVPVPEDWNKLWELVLDKNTDWDVEQKVPWSSVIKTKEDALQAIREILAKSEIPPRVVKEKSVTAGKNQGGPFFGEAGTEPFLVVNNNDQIIGRFNTMEEASEKVSTTPDTRIEQGGSPHLGGRTLASRLSVFHGTNARKVVNGHYEPLTEDDLHPTTDRPLFTSFDEMGAGYTRGKGQVIKLSVDDSKLASSDDLERVAQANGLSSDDMLAQDRDTHKLIKALQQEGFQGAKYFDQRHDNGDVIDAVVLWDAAPLNKNGEVLQSRNQPDMFTPQQPRLVANPSAVVDSMKAAADYVIEDNGYLWFHPFKLNQFRSVFEPAFGNKLRLQAEGGQWGFAINKKSFGQVSAEQLAMMPRPKVRTWSPSAFETMKSLFRQGGDSEEAADAQAAYNLNFLAEFKGSEAGVWGSLGEPNKYLGLAWGEYRIAGLAEGAQDQMALLGRHESAHMAGAHDDRYRTETPDVNAAMDYATKVFEGLSSDERKATLDSLVNLSNETKRLKIPDRYDAAVDDPMEFVAEFMSHAGDLLANSPKPSALARDMMRFLPDEVSNMVMYTTLRRHQALEILQQSISEQALMHGVSAENMHSAVKELTRTFKEMAREGLDIALDQAEFYRMRGLYPDMYKPLLLRLAARLDKVANIPTVMGGEMVDEPSALLSGRVLQSREPALYTEVKKAMGLDVDPRLPEKPSLWVRLLSQFAHFTEQHPIARPFYDMLESAQGLEKHRIAQISTLIAGSFEGGKVKTDERTKQVANFVKSDRLRQLFSKIALDVQTEGDAETKSKLSAVDGDVMQITEPVDVMTPEYMDAIYRKYGVSAADRQILDVVLNGSRNQIKAISSVLVSSHFESWKTIAATAIQRHTELNPEAARDASKVLFEAVALGQDIAEGRSTDLVKQAELEQQFMTAVPDPKVAQNLLQLMSTGYDQGRRLERFLSIRMPYYMSERRFGQFGLWWKDDEGKMQRHYFPSSDKRAQFIKGHDIEPARQTDPGDRNFGVDEGVFNYLNEIQTKLGERLKETFGETEGARLGTLMDAATELRTALSARDILKTSAPRKGSVTREFLDMYDTHQQYWRSVVTASKNRQMKLESELLLNAAEFANQPFIKNLLASHVNHIIKPDTEAGRLIQAVNFTYFMGANLSSMIIEPFQQLSALAPILTQHGATLTGSYGLISKANKAFFESKTRGNLYKDPELHDAITRAREDGVVDRGILAELEHTNDLSMINRRRVGDGQGEWNLFDMLKNRVYQTANLAMRFYGVVPSYNSEIAFVASYMHAKAQGKSAEQAYSDARFLTRQAMFGGGKINRPIGLFDAPRSAAQAMWSLQSYGVGMMTQMGYLIKRGLNPKGLTPAQATQVRKAAVQMLTTQFVLSGVLGMPFVQVALLSLQKLFPDLKVEETVRDALAQLSGDDDASGGWMGTALQTGVPSAFSNAPDFGSRFALSSTLGVSPYSGFTFDNFVGPTASVLTNVFKAMQAGVNGQPVAAVKDLIPRGPLRLWDAMEQQNKFMSKNKGTLLADDLSPLEIAGRSVGFTPARIQRLMDSERLKGVAQQAEKVEQRQWVDRTAGSVTEGKDDEARRQISERAAGGRDPRELARAVAKRVEEKTLPQDVRDLGNRSTLESQRRLRGVLGQQAQSPSNVERLQLQQQVLQRLGVPQSMPSRASASRASALDQLMELYPQLTTSQARLMLDRSARQRTPGLLEGLLVGDE